MPLVTVDGQQLHVLDEGSGPPVVLLHAFPLNAHMWDYQLEALADRWRLVAVDLPGFGGSPAPAAPKACTMDLYADLVAGVIRELALGPVVLGGISMGGYVAFAFVRRHAELLRGLVLADTRARSDDLHAWERRDGQQKQLEAGEPLENLAKNLVENVLGTDSLQRAELVEWVRGLMLMSDPAGWLGALEAMKNRPDSISTLSAVEVPSLVVVGRQDRLTPATEASLMSSRLSADRVEISGAGHLSNLENPVEFNEALVSFFQRVDAGAAGLETS